MTLKKDENFGGLPQEGLLIVAVSGGVDSVVLLDMLTKQIPIRRLVVAHVDHGIRPESDSDERFVRGLTGQYGLIYHSTKLNLGSSVSEATAREGRFKYLFELKDKLGAVAILTAHHQDDVVETIVMNVLRGTGRLGLSSLRDRRDIFRPLLNMTKQQIYNYALINRLEFVEDETNLTRAYQRNRVRLEILPELRSKNPKIDSKITDIYLKMRTLNSEIDSELKELLPSVIKDKQINRSVFATLPSPVRRELILTFSRMLELNLANINRGDIERAEEFILNALPAKRFNPTKQLHFVARRDFVEIHIIDA